MQRSTLLVLAVLAAAGTWYCYRTFEIRGLEGLALQRRSAESSTTSATGETLPVSRAGERIRIASFNLQVLGRTKLEKPQVIELIARIIRQFDVVALQEIRSASDDVLPQLVEVINATGRHYDYVIGPRLGRTAVQEQYAFVFDRGSLEVDRQQLYTVDDPDGLLHRPPLVGWFRVRGPPPDQAFTFTLVNVHVDPDEVDRELDVLDDVFRLVRDDGRGEDDVIMLGDFNAADTALTPLQQIPGMTCAVSATPTNTRGTRQYDNVLFQLPATREFTGLGGVLDFMRVFNLTVADALEVSDHVPVWAEFHAREGGAAGTVAEGPAEPRR